MTSSEIEKIFSSVGIKIKTKEEHLENNAKNITEFASTPSLGTVYPKNVSEVREIIHIANMYKIVLYPFSSGMNWGQGSRVTTTDNSLLIDLSALNTVLEVNKEHRYVVIETGVTQQKLYEELQGTQFKVPVTGSAAQSSVAGNMLERGATFLDIGINY